MDIYHGLPIVLQNKIKIYVLSYGTEETRFLKRILQRLLQFNKTYKASATLWQYNVCQRDEQIIQCNFKFRREFHIGDELSIAFMQSGLCTRTLDVQELAIYYAQNELIDFFKYHYKSLLVKHKYGTPTALLIRKISGRLKEDWGATADITLWRIRVFAKNAGKIKLFTYKKKECMEKMCNPPTIYNELIHAYHIGNTFSGRL